MKRKFDLTPIPSEDSVFGGEEGEEEDDVFPEVVMGEVQVLEVPLASDRVWDRAGHKVLFPSNHSSLCCLSVVFARFRAVFLDSAVLSVAFCISFCDWLNPCHAIDWWD